MVIHKRPGDTGKLVFFKINGELTEKKEFQDVGTEDMIIGVSDRGDLIVLVGGYNSGFGGHEVLLRFC
jgi:hypothetical protein